ncbi:MAG: Cthe_2314 family HEPN domain-containing protein [Bacteroidota bacterium]
MEIDYNEISLFTTPLGEAVQQEKTQIILGKVDSSTERAQYISKVNDSISSIAQSFWDIDLTVKLIEFANPKIKSFKMTRVDRGDYLKYHFENYFFRLPKLKDQVLNLLNVIFQLGYSQSNGLEKKIRNTIVLQEKKMLYFLDYFNDTFSKIKPLRDTIAHRGDLSDQNFAMLTSYSILKYDEDIYNSLLKSQISYTYIFQKNQGILKQAVITLLLVLYDDYLENLKTIDNQ